MQELKERIDSLKTSSGLIRQFFFDFEILDNIDPDLLYNIHNCFPDDDFYSSFTLDPELWKNQYRCKICKENFDSEEECFAIICSKGCFQEYYESDTYFKNRTIELLESLKKERDNELVKQNLEKLKAIAQSSDNLMPILIETVKSLATIEEICDVLREAFGKYQPPQII